MPRDAGLQAERTGLAWERSALTGLVGAALLLARHTQTSAALLTAGAAGLVVALLAAVTGWRRAARLRRPGPVGAARVEVLTVGVAVAVFAALVIGALVVG